MKQHPDLLAEVVQELNQRQGSIATIARETGISYDTVLRIKRQENDPGYSLVAALHRHLFGSEVGAQKAGA